MMSVRLQRPMKSGVPVLIVLLLAAPAGGTNGDVPDGAPRPRRVLALYSDSTDQPTIASFAQTFRDELKRQSGSTVEHYPEFFDSPRFAGESQKRLMIDYLRHKYADRTIDVVFAWGPFTLPLVLEYRAELFPDTPVVYYSGTLDEVKDLPQPPMTGVLNPDTYERTLEVALSLHPDTTEVFLISGTPARDKSIERDMARQLARFQGRVTLTYLTDLPLDRLIATVTSLPRRSIIIYSRQQSQENTGRVLQQSDYVDLVSRSAHVPLYGPWRSLLGYGSVGGVVDDREAGAAKAAAIVLRVARGARPQDVPPDHTPRIPSFDARQLKRWGISESRLPAGSVVLFREPTIWNEYRSYIVWTGVVLVVQSMLIGGLLVQRVRRRRAEGALRESEKRYALATAAGSVGVWDWNLQNDEIYVDPALKRALGFAEHEIGSRFDSWNRHVHPEDADRLHRDAHAHVGGRTASFEHERRMVHRDGSIRWFLTRGSAVRQADGSVTRITGTDMDITERKRAEADLEDARREFTRMARVTTLAHFAASIAHEVSQPLSAILMHSRAGLQRLAQQGGPTDEFRDGLLEIVDCANRAHEILTRDRDLFRNRASEKQEPLDITRIVDDVVALAQARLQQSGVTLSKTFDELPLVVGDRVQLQQVLLNLLLNSIEAMDTVDRFSRRLTIAARLDGEDLVEISVRDTGPGMRGVDVDRLFTPFYTTKLTGTGVGLSISRSIVEAHGGRLWVDPDGGPGATFRFTLPVATVGATKGDALP